MAASIEVTVDAKGMPLPPVDPNVPVPPSVRAASMAADAIHAQAYNTQAPPPPPPTQAPPPPPTQAPPSPPAQPQADDRASWDASKWMQHAKSMEGRFRQANEQVQTLQGHVTDLGEELVRAQSTVVRQPPFMPQPTQVQPLPRQVTAQDVETYGEDFLNVAQRAALDAIAPKLSKLEQDNNQLRNQLRKQTIQSIESVLDATIPNWPQINLSPKFKNYLRIRDIYSGKLRSEMLNEAHRAADASRVLNFFKGFLAEEEATGSTEFLPTQEPPPQAAPQTSVVGLEQFAAPGHARPAVGTQPNQSANEPIWITRGQISAFYANVRKGVYVGREQDYMNDQAIIFECQRAGRIR